MELVHFGAKRAARIGAVFASPERPSFGFANRTPIGARQVEVPDAVSP